MTHEQQQLATDNMALAWAMVNKWRPDPREKEEYEGEALLGLVHAARTYKPELGWAFSTHAWHVIGNRLTAIRRHKEHKGRDALVLPLQEDFNGQYTLPAPEVDCPVEAADEFATLAAAAKRVLTPKERYVLWATYKEGMKLRDVGKRLGVTHERVRQIREQAVTKLREHYGVAA